MDSVDNNDKHIMLVSLEQQALVETLREYTDGDTIAMVLIDICSRLDEARKKHPRFAEQVYHALSFLSEEHGEAVREVTKSEPGWEERMDSELLDLVAVAMRMLLREYDHGEDA